MITPVLAQLGRNQPCVLGLPESEGVAWYSSRIVAIENERMWVECPADEKRPITSWRNAEVKVEAGRTHDAWYSMTARVVGGEFLPQPCLMVEILSSERIQRREYFRVSISIPVESSLIINSSQSHVDQELEGRAINLQVRDVSAGGMGVLIQADSRQGEEIAPAVGDTIRLSLRLPEFATVLTVEARVMRLTQRDHTLVPTYEVGAAFIELPREQREVLIQYVLRAQRALVQKGLIL